MLYDGDDWVALPTTVDTENNTAIAYTNHFTDAVGASPYTGTITIGGSGEVRGDGTDNTPRGVFEALVVRIMNFLFRIGLFVVPILVVIGGFIYMTAGGDPTRTTGAKKLILWSLIGFGILLSGKIILAILKYILQIQ